MPTFGARLKHAWNAFANRNDEERPYIGDYALSMGRRPERWPMRFSNERSIISSIYTRIGIDVASVEMLHVRTDEQKRYLEEIESGLNYCLTEEANLDQAARQFRQDIAMTILDEGVAAIVPVDTTISPMESGGYDIKTLRVGRIVSWFPKHVTVNLYNEDRGLREDITLPKKIVAIVENPLYSVMNEPNSTLQRLIVKLGMLDTVDKQSASGKLDIIIQLPFTIKSDARRQQAEQRRKDIEFQLAGSQYGIAYADATEKIVQLNRPAENNLMAQVEYLTKMLYAQLGLTEEIMNGTADEKTMLNYMNRTIEPICDSIVEAMRRSFLTKTARSQHQTILYFHDPFKLIPLGGEGGIADIADKLSRNEIASSNELRQKMGWKPRPEPKADALQNSNMPQGDIADPVVEEVEEPPDPAVDEMMENLRKSEAELDALLEAGE